MKMRIIKTLAFAIMLVLICVGCKKNKDNGNGGGDNVLNSMSLKQMNLTHAKMLALADNPDNANSDYRQLYIVTDEGVLDEVEYTIEVDGNDNMANLLRAHLQLKAHYIYEIGDEWLWLFDCRHYYPGIEQLSEAERNAILNLIAYYDGLHYLVRKSDGAIFKWTLEDGRPYNIVNYGLEHPTDFYGIVEQYDDDIVEVKTQEANNQIYYLEDKGNSIDISTMIPNGIYPQSVYPAENDGVIGATIAYNITNGFINYQPFVIFPSSRKMTQVVVPNYHNSLKTTTQLVSVDNTLYVMSANVYQNYSETDFRKVQVDAHNETVSVSPQLVNMEGEVELNSTTIGYQYPVFHGDKIWWLQNGKINALYPATSYYNSMDLPAHFPNDAKEYIDGVAYVIDNPHDAAHYWICDMSMGFAMKHNIEMPDLGEYNDSIVAGSNSDWVFNYNSLTFTSYCMLLDGRKLNFYFSVVGDDAGQVQVVTEGEGGMGRAISTLIRLN